MRLDAIWYSASMKTSVNDPCISDVTDPAIISERTLVVKVLRSAVQMLGCVVGRNTEVVLHDLTNPQNSILAIANGHVSGRQTGSSVLAGPQNDRGFSAVMQEIQDVSNDEPSVVGGYETLTRSGKKLRSATVVYRDAQGHPFASLCVNSDVSGIEAAQACLAQLLATGTQPESQSSEPPDMEYLMMEIIQGAMQHSGTKNGAMNKKAKLEAVRQMQDRGIFIVKGGVEKAAKALGVTRYTIYNYLEEIRQSQNVAKSQTSSRKK